MDRRIIFTLLALFALLGSSAAAVADGGDEREKRNERSERDRDNDDDDDDRDDKREKHRRDYQKRGDKWIFHNDQIAVWFHAGRNGEAKPDFRIAINGTDGNTSGYRVKILRLYEAEENSTQFRGSMPNMNLARRDDWNVQKVESNESLTLTMVRAEQQGILTLVWHINTTSAEVKYDVKVDNWAWSPDSEGHRLVLDMLVQGKDLRNETGARVSVGDAGYIAWDTTAKATYADGTNATLNVTAEQKRSDDDDDDKDDDEKDDDDDDRKGNAHLLLVFNGPAGYTSLDYDPTFGVMNDSAKTFDVPGFGAAFVALAVVGAAFVVSRRRA